MKQQSRRLSLIESITQTAVGFLVSLLVQLVLYPLMGIPVTFAQNLWITGVFTVVSVGRGYVLRRVFERRRK